MRYPGHPAWLVAVKLDAHIANRHFSSPLARFKLPELLDDEVVRPIETHIAVFNEAFAARVDGFPHPCHPLPIGFD